MVVFVLVWIHELVDVFAVPVVLVDWRRRDWLGRPGFPLVAEPCVEPWDVAAADLAVVDGVLVAAERGLESGQFDGGFRRWPRTGLWLRLRSCGLSRRRIRDRFRRNGRSRIPAWRVASVCRREGSERVYRYRYRFYAMFLLGCPLATC